MSEVRLERTKPRENSRCTCCNPLYSFSVCAQCKKVIYNKEEQSETRKRAVILSIELTRMINEYQNIIEYFDCNKPEEIITVKEEFKNKVNRIIEESFEKEKKVIERYEREKKTTNKRELILKEILSTEKDYGNDIELLKKYYMPCLKKYLKEDGNRIEEIINKMKGVSSELIEILEGKSNIIEEIYEKVDKLKVYEEYFNIYHRHAKSIESLRRNEEFESIKRANKELRKLDIMDFLVKPIQRITKYPLFMKEIKPLLVSIDTIEMGSKIEHKIQVTLRKQNENQRKIISEEMIKAVEPRLNWKKFDKSYSLTKSDVCLLLINERVTIIQKNFITNSNEKEKKDEEAYDCLITFTDFVLFGKMKLLNKIVVAKYIELSKCSIDLKNCQPNEVLLTYQNTSYLIQFGVVADKSIWVTKFTEIPHHQLLQFPLCCENGQTTPKSSEQPNDIFNILTTFNPNLLTKSTPSLHSTSITQSLHSSVNSIL